MFYNRKKKKHDKKVLYIYFVFLPVNKVIQT